MTKIEMLKYLESEARSFRADRGHYAINRHMHAIRSAPSQDVVDAVLAGFINHIGRSQGVDYALYAADLGSGEPDATPSAASE